MAQTKDIAKFADISNAVYTSITANAIVITSILVATDLRVGNTSTNVIIANTTSTFGGNVAVTGEVKVSGALVDNSNRRLLIRDSANNIIWGG
jgi:hypothetical protein